LMLLACANTTLDDKGDPGEDEPDPDPDPDPVPDKRFNARELRRELFSPFSRCFSASWMAATIAGSKRGSFNFDGSVSGIALRFEMVGVVGGCEDDEEPADEKDDAEDRLSMLWDESDVGESDSQLAFVCSTGRGSMDELMWRAAFRES
jgi:hypothetical protein